MLYVTTRDHADAYTAYRTLGANRGSDQGLFVPRVIPKLEQEQILALKDKSYGQNIADVLNLYFNARMDSWDVDSTIGRHTVHLVAMSHRVMVAEAWRNPDNDFSRFVRNLSSRLRGTVDSFDLPTNWAWIAVRIATLFGLYGELCKLNVTDSLQPIDVALPSGDFAGPMAVWYARRMGLPIANIICCCDENDGFWELLHDGKLNCGGNAVIPSDLERLIDAVLGPQEVKRFLRCVKDKGIYTPPEGSLKQLGDGLYPAVISWSRRSDIIRGVYNSSTYILDPGSAMAYGGLQDHRAVTGEGRPALILTERSPILSADTVAAAMGISVELLKNRLNLD